MTIKSLLQTSIAYLGISASLAAWSSRMGLFAGLALLLSITIPGALLPASIVLWLISLGFSAGSLFYAERIKFDRAILCNWLDYLIQNNDASPTLQAPMQCFDQDLQRLGLVRGEIRERSLEDRLAGIQGLFKRQQYALIAQAASLVVGICLSML